MFRWHLQAQRTDSGAPTGLAETLRSELILYGIKVHAYFPATILSPGLTEENKTKPKVTLDIEGGDEGLSPEKCARGLVKGKSTVGLSHVHTTHAVLQGSRRGTSSSRPTSTPTCSGLLRRARRPPTTLSSTVCSISSRGSPFPSGGRWSPTRPSKDTAGNTSSRSVSPLDPLFLSANLYDHTVRT